MFTDKQIKLAIFAVDVTPEVGHPLCCGWLPPALGTTDPVLAKGIVLTDGEQPVVLCAIDWCEISNHSYEAWKRVLAEAAGTIPERVTVHCTHPHCTPWMDEYAQQLVDGQDGIDNICDVAWCNATLHRVGEMVRRCTSRLQPVTHLEVGRARVDRVASNRRILGPDGKIKAVRWTRTEDPAVRAEPEGLIDPWLKTISLWNEDSKLAVLHYYAVHPTSYQDSYITPDFTGLARERRQADDSALHVYFTECAGNITAGKYNDGAHELREVFTDRICQAMVEAERQARRVPIKSFRWVTAPVYPPPGDDATEAHLTGILTDSSQPSRDRSRAAFKLAYLERSNIPITIAALHFDQAVSLLHLPAEAFMEYQYFAQQQRPNRVVAVPAYGDCGPGYICMERSYEEGGYEPIDSFVSGKSEAVLKAAIAQVLSDYDCS